MEIILLQNTIVGGVRHTAGSRINVNDTFGEKMVDSGLAWSEQPKQPENPESETENPESETETTKPKAVSKKTAAGAKK